MTRPLLRHFYAIYGPAATKAPNDRILGVCVKIKGGSPGRIRSKQATGRHSRTGPEATIQTTRMKISHGRIKRLCGRIGLRGVNRP